MPILASPWWLLLWLNIPFLIWWMKRKPLATLPYSNTSLLELQKPHAFKDNFVVGLRCAAWFFLVLAMARPQRVSYIEESLTRGVDIMLAIDTSSSMKALDFQPQNRLEASKDVIAEFVKMRKHDRIGSVVFSSLAYTQCPLTTDHKVLLDLIQKIQIGEIEDGTAIGLAVATAVKKLSKSEAKSRIVILLSDGENNAGGVDPLVVAKLAKSLDIKVYSIGIGKKGKVLYPVVDPFGRTHKTYVDARFNEKGLKDLANESGGKYFRAEKKEELKKIYDDINELEKTDIKLKQYRQYKEYFFYLLWIGFFLIFLEYIWTYWINRRYPE
ncbi:hypothetical protein AB834_06195 [PVC group bacterium (ex Bugula neritina AB1)]|nr:hypothetical protein AB834_06195 [PVC group bacterium (ex Bugula neritina AB1)]